MCFNMVAYNIDTCLNNVRCGDSMTNDYHR